MKDSITLWLIDSDNKKGRVPQVFSKVLLNFMLGRYPINVFEKFSKCRLEYILGELLSKATDKNFFSEMRPGWWPESIEFVPLSVLSKKIEKDTHRWILHLQELLLSAREFYCNQLYLSHKRNKKLVSGEENKRKDRSKKTKSKINLKISPAIFKPVRNENNHPNYTFPNIHYKSVLIMESKDMRIIADDGPTRSIQTSIFDGHLNTTPAYAPLESSFLSLTWKPYVYLNDIFKKKPFVDLVDLTHYTSKNCQVKVHDIFKTLDKASYMNTLGLYATPVKSREKTESLRSVKYKRYSPTVPFSSIGGQLILGSFKDRYHHNSICERNARRGCSINDPLRRKVLDVATDTVANTAIKNALKKIKSYHVYKFCRRRPLNYLDLPSKITDEYCRNIIVNVDRLTENELKAYMPQCKVVMTGILPAHAKYLQKYKAVL